MITGHFTTALVPYAKDKSLPLFFLLIVSQAPDFLIPVDIARSGDGNFRTLEMTYSHDLLPVLVLSLIVGAIAQVLFKNRKLTLWTIGLILLHELCDAISGFAHNIYGLTSPRFGFDFYRTAPVTAYAIELLLSISCVGYFLYTRKKQGEPLTVPKTGVLLGIVFLPTVSMMILALMGKPLI